MLKDEKGITLMVLVLTVTILAILAFTAVKYGNTTLGDVKLQNLSYELQQIQARVDVIYEKMKTQSTSKYIRVDGKTMGDNITGYTDEKKEARETLKDVTGIDYLSSSISTTDPEFYTDSAETMYRYFSIQALDEGLDIKNARSPAIINFKTREVISVKGENVNGKPYYTMEHIKKED